MPTILLINDDGIRSLGLVVLRKHLAKLGEVVVIAPEKEQSGIGKALSISTIRLMKTRLSDGSEAYAITGTPADAFLIAVNKILKHPPDLLVAGINLGPNLGIDDMLNSGTLGAALEAAIHGVPALAISYCMRKITEGDLEKMKVSLDELELSAVMARRVAEYILKRGMPPDVDIISVNVPENADPKRIKITSLSYKGYGDIHTECEGGYRITKWFLSSYPDDEPETDIHTVKEGIISITPIKVRMVHNKQGMKNLLRTLLHNDT